MKKTLFSAISLLILFTVFFAVSCTNDDEGASQDLFYISNDIRAKVTEGIKSVSVDDKTGFDNRLEALVGRCSKPELASDMYACLETEEYKEFKQYIISIAPDSYYLLIEIFLKGETLIPHFTNMFQDIIEASYPGLISSVLDKLEKVSMDEFILAYPQVCVKSLLIEMEKEK
ncbi:MAG: hypothetical protein LUG98_12850 [Tannerellaceae bacterium]|nr:hypothetical protein [Tannerellaceae bacterium]